MKCLKTIVVLIVSTAFVQHYVLSNQLPSPTIRLMVTKKELDYLNDIGLDIVIELIQSQLEGYEIHGSAKSVFHYDIENITLDELNVQKSSIFSNLQTGLNLVLTNVSLNISTNLALSLGSLYYIRSFIKDSLVTASMTISTTGLSLHLAVIVNRDEQGQPVFNVTNCSFYAGDYHIKFGGEQGPAAALHRIFKSYADKYISDGKIFCGIVKSQAEDAIKRLLPSQPVIPIEKYAGIRYALVSQPIFTQNYIVTEHEGDFNTLSVPNVKPPFDRVSVPPFEPGHCVDKMACLWVTEYVANTASAVYKRAGKLVFNITEDTVEDDDDLKKKLKKSFFKLDTSTFSLIVPQLFHRYSDQNLTLTVRAVKEVPHVNITEEQAMLTIPAAVDVYVNNTDQNILPVAFTMSMFATINATVGIGNNTDNKTFTITANATGVNMEVKDNGSNIGDIDYNKINKLIKVFKLIKEHLIPSLNKQTKSGYGVSLVDYLTFVEPNLTYFKGGLLLGTDFNYEIT